ncbi:lipocalin family protein [Flavobacterium antarcticum]|uniref:lipocalin family protein n=1 Tax=Flavobacterium antarcticum TaxID=271155 RepID=UPI0003B623FB|nr:lipocalin family protein [Flavobacterium antarcticum]
MKKIKALMFAFVLAGMTVVSCSSDDDSGPAPTIDGKWTQTQTTVTVNNAAPQKFIYDENTVGCDKNYYEFAAGAVFKDVVYFKQGGDCQQSVATPGTWAKNNNTLTISGAGNVSGVYEITSLSNKGLQISVTNNEGGVKTVTTIFMTKL